MTVVKNPPHLDSYSIQQYVDEAVAEGTPGAAGPALIAPNGTYNSQITYGKGDLVSQTANLLTAYYLNLLGSTGVAPPDPASRTSNATWQLLAGPGSTGPAGASAKGMFTPDMFGLNCWNDRPTAIGSNATPSLGQLLGGLVPLQAGDTLTGMEYDFEAAGTLLTLGQVLLYSPDGQTVWQTADLHAVWNSTATFNTRSPFAVAGVAPVTGLYIALFLQTGTTGAKFGCIGPGGRDSSVANPGVNNSQPRIWGRWGLTGLTSAPATISPTPSAPSNQNYYLGVYH